MIYLGNCLDVLQTLAAESIDSIVTDPPYGLGFMGKEWDHSVPGAPFWEAMLRVAKPGAYLAAFGGTRTFHRMACAIEDAGWELRDTLMWVYGSGFPKSHNGEWGGTALKPAWEPIILARKPLVGTVEANWRQHGTGALNIDGCRVEGIAERPGTTPPSAGERGSMSGDLPRQNYEPDQQGRWPANVLHDGSCEVISAFPNAPGQIANASSSRMRKTQNVYGAMSCGNGRDGEASQESENAGAVGFNMKPGARRGDAGSAARFFYCAKASKADRDDGLDAHPVVVTDVLAGHRSRRMEEVKRPDGATPSVGRNNHPTVKPTDLMRWLCRLVTPPGGHVLDPFTGSGSTGRAAVMEGMRFTGIELDPEYVAIAEARIRAAQPGLSFGDAA